MLQTALVLGLILGGFILFFWLFTDKECDEAIVFGGIGFLLEFICIPSLIFLPERYRIGIDACFDNIGTLVLLILVGILVLCALSVVVMGLYTIIRAIDIISGHRLSRAFDKRIEKLFPEKDEKNNECKGE